MGASKVPLPVPPLALLLGQNIEQVVELVNHGYRATWKVRAGGDDFVVKIDTREGYQAREVQARQRAEAAGVSVPPAVLFRAESVPTFVMRWVDGEPLHGSKAPAAWRAAGRALRQVHSVSPLQREKDASRLVLELLEPELPYLVEKHGLTNTEAALVLSHARRMQPLLAVAPLAWLHGDCQADHFLIDRTGGGLNALIDWADAQAGDPVLDFAVVSLFDEGVLPHVLDGYEARPALRERVDRTLPLYQAVRGAQAARWLDDHGYAGHEWPLRCVRRVAALEASMLHGG